MVLAIFDNSVSDVTKAAMVANSMKEPNRSCPRRIPAKEFNFSYPLQHYVTSRSLKIFDLVCSESEKSLDFLKQDPSTWPTDVNYRKITEKIKNLKVVNDCAERAISLIESYNSTLTINEEQKQYLLQSLL